MTPTPKPLTAEELANECVAAMGDIAPDNPDLTDAICLRVATLRSVIESIASPALATRDAAIRERDEAIEKLGAEVAKRRLLSHRHLPREVSERCDCSECQAAQDVDANPLARRAVGGGG